MKKANSAGNPTGKNSRGRKFLLTICIIAAVLAVLAAGYAIWERPPEIVGSESTPIPSPTEAAFQPGTTPTEDETAQPEGAEETEEVDYTNALVTDREPGTYTFMLVGRDAASNSTDTIIVGKMDTVAHTIRCISIPRDTLINIKWANTPKKLNAVYPGFVNSGKDGVEGLRTQLKNLLGFDVDCYAVVSIKAVEEVVDTIGGVWFDVPVDMHYVDPTQDLYIDIDQGYQLLDGENAVKVCRFRDSYAGGDIERIGVQQSFLKTMARQVLDLGNIPNLGSLAEIIANNTETDLSVANIAWFARQFLLCDMEDISFETMPWSVGCLINGTSYVSVDLSAWLEMVNTRLNPYVEPVTRDNVNILISNSDGTDMWATNGEIAGGEDSFFCMTCTIQNGGVGTHHLPGCCPNS